MPNSSVNKSSRGKTNSTKGKASQLYVYIVQTTYLEADFMICLAHTLQKCTQIARSSES